MDAFPPSLSESTLVETVKYKAERRAEIVKIIAQSQNGKKDCQFSVNKEWATADLDVLRELSRHPDITRLSVVVRQDPKYFNHCDKQTLALGDIPVVMLEDARLICTVHLVINNYQAKDAVPPLCESGQFELLPVSSSN